MSQTIIETPANTKFDLAAIQSALRENKLDGWLFYDHHHRDPLAYSILGLDPTTLVSRRWFYFIPADSGEPKKLVHRIESFKLDTLPGTKSVYSSWQELESQLQTLLTGATKIAMQYSPRNAIMYVSMVDAGTIELLRTFGKEPVTSADLVSHFEAVLTDAQLATHYVAQRAIDELLEAAWKEIGTRCPVWRHSPNTPSSSTCKKAYPARALSGSTAPTSPPAPTPPTPTTNPPQPTPAPSAPATSSSSTSGASWLTTPPPSGTTSPGPASSTASPPSANNSSSPPYATPVTPQSKPSRKPSPPTPP